MMMKNPVSEPIDKILMAGIDWTHADISQRETFAFTENTLNEALLEAKTAHPEGESGCIIVATCNRTEIWLHGDAAANPAAILCAQKGINSEDYRNIFVQRQGIDAVRHLFLTAGGLKSQIVGENQILGQIKDALDLARKAKSGGAVLDRLFQAAITSAKRIKTETGITKANASTAQTAIDCIKARCGSLAGKNALVIGNGVIGRLCAELLLREGAAAGMTLRRHKQIKSPPPAGCTMLNYDERYAALTRFDIVISATSSPHWTLNYEETARVWDGRERLFVDLALPRDMEPQLRTLDGLSLLDLDSLPCTGAASTVNIEPRKIELIVSEEIDRFFRWLDFRPHLKTIQMIETAIAAGKPVSKLLFALRDTLDRNTLNECFDALKKSLEGGAPPYGRTSLRPTPPAGECPRNAPPRKQAPSRIEPEAEPACGGATPPLRNNRPFLSEGKRIG
ncbi:MAG: glutamyl-tRNA reductase, partial [Spirochaetaceae bacterium]|nr:glutamyl-tRNA reductase [Spirochaetaceae bacterium]